ncbi:hypothetical protein HanRHA438_Chr12g0532531 [Helianthus annuus]|nr:hypothetical protein HanRHA438_Chr12g0532531 [Helianthus annuus]
MVYYGAVWVVTNYKLATVQWRTNDGVGYQTRHQHRVSGLKSVVFGGFIAVTNNGSGQRVSREYRCENDSDTCRNRSRK